jgi:hypothetical protein
MCSCLVLAVYSLWCLDSALGPSVFIHAFIQWIVVRWTVWTILKGRLFRDCPLLRQVVFDYWVSRQIQQHTCWLGTTCNLSTTSRRQHHLESYHAKNIINGSHTLPRMQQLLRNLLQFMKLEFNHRVFQSLSFVPGRSHVSSVHSGTF